MARIIIARYNENIEWASQFDNVIIYNKGEPIVGDNVIPLDNVGREGHTYYTHIYNNYDNLDDYTIFLQGRPFDHSPNIIKNIQHYNKLITLHEMSIDFAFLSEWIISCDLVGGCRYHPNLPLMPVYNTLFGEIDNKEFKFGAGAQFIVSKEQILKHPREFYLKIVQLLENHINPIEGFVIERFHGLILRGI